MQPYQIQNLIKNIRSAKRVLVYTQITSHTTIYVEVKKQLLINELKETKFEFDIEYTKYTIDPETNTLILG